jgi:hypothetical protein
MTVPMSRFRLVMRALALCLAYLLAAQGALSAASASARAAYSAGASGLVWALCSGVAAPDAPFEHAPDCSALCLMAAAAAGLPPAPAGSAPAPSTKRLAASLASRTIAPRAPHVAMSARGPPARLT